MTLEQRDNITQLLCGRFGPNIWHEGNDFYIFRATKANKGVYRHVIIKENRPTINVYGGYYANARRIFGERMRAELPNLDVEVPTSNCGGMEAVWFNVKHREVPNEWYNQREQVVQMAVSVMEKLTDWGALGTVDDLRQALNGAPPPQNNAQGEVVKDGEMEMTEKIKTLLQNVGQVILHGAPGTGKTFLARQIAAALTGDNLEAAQQEHIKMVQFHAGYDYSDFVLGLKPKLVGPTGQQSVSFEWKSGVFKQFAEKAKEVYDMARAANQTAQKFVFIIDEINRADLSRVFGELFSLVEKDYRYPRNKIGITLSDNTKMVIPENLYIIGTMNDIDRSVESMDFALRRRFAWCEIDAKASQTILDTKIADQAVRERLKKAMDELNKKIDSPEVGLGTDYQIGGAIFANYASCGTTEPYKRLWEVYLKTILKEYLRGNRQRKEHLDAMKDVFMKALQGA